MKSTPRSSFLCES